MQERLRRLVSIPGLFGVLPSAFKGVVVHLSHCRAKCHYRAKLAGQYEQSGRCGMPVNRLFAIAYQWNQKDR